jgi:hypothetical protein
MKCVIRSKCGYYANVNFKPVWGQSLAQANVFPRVRVAEGVVAILRRNNIHAKVLKIVGGGDAR